MIFSLGSQVDVPLQDDKNLLGWLEDQPNQLHEQLTQGIIANLLEQLGSSRHASGDVCIKVCHLIDQFRRSNSSNIRNCVYSDIFCLQLFSFFLEFNDKSQGRSMRRVLELVSTLIARNLNKSTVDSVRTTILHKILYIIHHQSVKPFIKPALRSLEFFLAKSSISIYDFLEALEKSSQYEISKLVSKIDTQDVLWDFIINDVFELISFPEFSQIASKLLVTIYHETKKIAAYVQNFGNRVTSWQSWTQKALEKNPELLESIRNYLLPSLFNLDKPGSLIFLEDISKALLHSQCWKRELDAQALLRLAALEVGKKNGLVEEQATFQFQKASKNVTEVVVIKDGLIEPFLTHSSVIVRLLSFSTLVSSSSPLRPLSSATIRQIKSKLYILFSETDVKSRNDILSITKKLIERLKGSTAFLVKEINFRKSQLDDSNFFDKIQKIEAQCMLENFQSLLQHQSQFITWFFEFLVEELVPTASYQRHAASLKAITLWLSSGIIHGAVYSSRTKSIYHETVWPFYIDFFIPESVRLLIDLLVNPFEDIRALASGILKMSSPSHFIRMGHSVPFKSKMFEITLVPNFQQPLFKLEVNKENCESDESLRFLKNFIKHIEEISDKTGRADYADGLARSYELLHQLQPCNQDQNRLLTDLLAKLTSKSAFAKQNLARAVHEAPLHGIIASINLIWGSMEEKVFPSDLHVEKIWLQDFQEKSTEICSQIWTFIGFVLCNDSPEGYLLDENDDSVTVNTKDILSYSFRAIHESSNLLRTFLGKDLKYSSGPALLSKETFLKISNLSYEMLSSLRHRGAFSSVSVTFSACCKLAPHFSSTVLNTWLEGAFFRLKNQASTTRRSAGIPLTITAIMAAMSMDDFEKIIKELLETSKTEIKLESDQQQLPQVHALNTLREIVKSVTTNTKVDAYISQCFEVVGQCLGSPIWAIRNSALVLLRGLIDNLIGTSGNSVESEIGWDGRSVRIQYEKYPALTRILIQLFQYNTNPIACDENKNQIILPALSIIRRAGPPIGYYDYFYQLVHKILGSKTWHLREQAARTILALSKRGTELEIVKNLIENPGENMNKQHGSILTAKLLMLERVDVSRCKLCQLDDLYHLILKSRNQKCNPFILSEYIELQNATMLQILAHPDVKDKNQKNKHVRQIFKAVQDFGRPDDFEGFSIEVSSDLKSGFELYHRSSLCKEISSAIIFSDEPAIMKAIEKALALGNDMLVATLDQIVPMFKINISEKAFSGIISAITKVLETTEDSSVVFVTLNTLSQIFRITGMFSQANGGLVQELMRRLQKFFTLDTKIHPKLMSSYYELSGFVILHSLSCPLISQNFKDKIMDNWVQILKEASDVSQEFDMRYAVVMAIKDFFAYFPQINETVDCINYNQELNFITATLLEDDDEDIRRAAASVVSNLLGCSMCPLAALDAIFRHHIKSTHQEVHHGWNCIQNLLIFDNSDSFFDPVDPGHALQTASAVDHSLFCVEESNLFSDPCRRLDYFGNFFLEFEFRPEPQLLHQKSGTQSELTFLLKWASKGLLGLQQRYPTKKETDNVLPTKIFATSLTSVFIVIRKIIACSKIALAYWEKNLQSISHFKECSKEGRSLVESWEIQVQKLRQGLALICLQTDIHDSLRKFAAKQTASSTIQ